MSQSAPTHKFPWSCKGSQPQSPHRCMCISCLTQIYAVIWACDERGGDKKHDKNIRIQFCRNILIFQVLHQM